jgi:glycine/D-amino acid oxidase-like deaminating enzyme
MTNSQYDAIVVGARCAGSPAAMLLARKGYRVLSRSLWPNRRPMLRVMEGRASYVHQHVRVPRGPSLLAVLAGGRRERFGNDWVSPYFVS